MNLFGARLDESSLREFLAPTLTTASDGLTMRPGGASEALPEGGCEKQRAQPDRGAGEAVGAALLAIDHAHGIGDAEAGLAQGGHGLDGGAAGGDDVLDEADALAGLECALDAVGGAVLLLLAA